MDESRHCHICSVRLWDLNILNAFVWLFCCLAIILTFYLLLYCPYCLFFVSRAATLNVLALLYLLILVFKICTPFTLMDPSRSTSYSCKLENNKDSYTNPTVTHRWWIKITKSSVLWAGSYRKMEEENIKRLHYQPIYKMKLHLASEFSWV